jgi:hypothetical protein
MYLLQGRGPEMDLRVQELSVSRFHAVLKINVYNYYLKII